MSLLLLIVLIFLLFGMLSACFEEQPLERWLQVYLAKNKTCQDTLFPVAPCCGASMKQMQARIIDGEKSNAEELPWVVYITMNIQMKDKQLTGICSGALINSLWVLSAAHCFNAATGTFQSNEIVHFNTYKIPIKKILLHPKQDLSLLRLSLAIKYSHTISPICLPLTPLKAQCYINKPTIVAAWGRTNPNRSIDYPIKMKTALYVLSKMYCSAFTIHPYEFCATSYGSSSTCMGDSGAPVNLLLANDTYYQLGVVSRGSPNCSSLLAPNIFTSLDLKWIRQSIRDYESFS